MAKSKKVQTPDADEVLQALAGALDLLNQYVTGNGGKPVGSVGADEVDEDEDEDEEGEWEALDREETEALGIKELRAIAVERGIEEKKKADILAALEEGGHFGEDEEDEDEDEEGDEDEDEDEEDVWDRETLEEMDLKQLRAVAKEEGHSAADIKGKDQDALIDLILGEDEEEDEDEDEEEAEDEETEELDEDALKAMSLTELRALAKELEITVKVPKAHKDGKSKEKKFFIETILNSGEDE